MGLGHAEHSLFRLVQNGLHVPHARFVDVADDGLGCPDEASEKSLLPNDPSVVLDIGRGRDRVEEGRQVLQTPDVIQLPRPLQLLGNGDDVQHQAPLEHPGHGPEQAAVPFPEEHGVIHELHGSGHRVRVDEHAPQHRDLGLVGDRRLPVEFDRRIGRGDGDRFAQGRAGSLLV